MSVDINDLDEHSAAEAKAAEEDEFEEVDEETSLANKLESASYLLKQSAILFEFISDPDLCKSISKRERGIISKQVKRIYQLVEEADAVLEEHSEF